MGIPQDLPKTVRNNKNGEIDQVISIDYAVQYPFRVIEYNLARNGKVDRETFTREWNVVPTALSDQAESKETLV